MAEILYDGPLVSVHSEGLAALEAMFADSPDIVAGEFRVYVGRLLNAWRRDYVATVPGRKKKLIEGGGPRKPGVVTRAYPGGSERLTGNQERERAKGLRLDEIEGQIVIVKKSTILHERGGVLRPKAGRLLAVPVGTWRNPKTRLAQLGGLTPQDIPRERLFRKGRRRRGRGQLVLFTKTNRSGKARTSAVFVLKRQVTMPASLGIQRHWEGYEFGRRSRLNDAVEKARQRIIDDFRRRAQRVIGRIAG